MIGFAGLSHLGVVSSIVAASKGLKVVAYDPQPDVCEGVEIGKLPVLEPQLPELLSANRERISFTSEGSKLGGCDLIYLSLDLPTDEENKSDLSGLRQLMNQVMIHVGRGAVLVLLSQVPPGLTRRLSLEHQSILGDRGVQLFYQVETLIFGCAVERALHPERYIVGCLDPRSALPKPYHEYLSLFGCPILTMRYESAELAKIAINIFLSASISATNTLAEVCEAIGADWTDIASTLRLDRRIGQHAYLTPGLGIGGGNLLRDLITVEGLAEEHGINDCVTRAFIRHSRYRCDWVIKTLHHQVLSCRKDATIAVWGLAYKPNTKSTKNSPTLSLLKSLSDFKVKLYDPQATFVGENPNVVQTSSPIEACQGADALVIMTAWEEFAEISIPAVKKALVQPLVIDPSLIWRERPLAEEGFVYSTLGRAVIGGETG